QLRLRNLTGMILVDFINMEHAADKEKLLAQLRHSTAH
ncbi:MAG: ribonuclease E/G, partial [Clostridia bacterium]|nr:ribonuclease E/G [Clostridia bacterium]